MDVAATQRRATVGRPPVGERVVARLPADLLAEIDRRAVALGRSRASVIRSLLEESLGRSLREDDGVDRAQLHRSLALTPSQRMHHAVELAAQHRRLRGAARRGR